MRWQLGHSMPWSAAAGVAAAGRQGQMQAILGRDALLSLSSQQRPEVVVVPPAVLFLLLTGEILQRLRRGLTMGTLRARDWLGGKKRTG